MSTTPHTSPVDLLQAFGDAFNRHDLDAIMSMMTDDCVFTAAGGPSPAGTRFEGQAAVRAAFAQVIANFPDVQWKNGRHFASGDRGLSEWTFSAARPDGSRIEANGCDAFILRDGKIAVKEAYRKDCPPVPAA